MKRNQSPAMATARKLVVSVVGATVVLLGVALLFLPGPGLLIMAVGVAILATEYLWARRLMKKIRKGATKAAKKVGVSEQSRLMRWIRGSRRERKLYTVGREPGDEEPYSAR